MFPATKPHALVRAVLPSLKKALNGAWWVGSVSDQFPVQRYNCILMGLSHQMFLKRTTALTGDGFQYSRAGILQKENIMETGSVSFSLFCHLPRHQLQGHRLEQAWHTTQWVNYPLGELSIKHSA